MPPEGPGQSRTVPKMRKPVHNYKKKEKKKKGPENRPRGPEKGPENRPCGSRTVPKMRNTEVSGNV